MSVNMTWSMFESFRLLPLLFYYLLQPIRGYECGWHGCDEKCRDDVSHFEFSSCNRHKIKVNPQMHATACQLLGTRTQRNLIHPYALTGAHMPLHR